jgi:hypothetical protein
MTAEDAWRPLSIDIDQYRRGNRPLFIASLRSSIRQRHNGALDRPVSGDCSNKGCVSRHVAGPAVATLQTAMPLPNRVTPFGELIATPARGTLLGNRGGRFHGDGRTLTRRRWASKQWICCELQFKNRHRSVWGDGYTELFFLDEVTGLAAGHRPCFECRRAEAERFARLFSGIDANSAHSRASGNPELGPRFRGDERNAAARERISAPMMDRILHAERLDGRTKRVHRLAFDTLPDGAVIARGDAAFAVRGDKFLRWTPAGYAQALPRPPAGMADVLTPPSILAVLVAGYAPLWHKSATAASF